MERLVKAQLHASPSRSSKALKDPPRIKTVEEGVEGLEDRPHGRPPGVRRVDLKAIEAFRRVQQNPNLGAFRVHAALAQVGIHLSPRTCGRILAPTAPSTA
jgi:hypothetical protein